MASPLPPRTRRLLRVVGLLAACAVLAVLGLGGFLDAYGQRERARPAQVIIVLGARLSPDGQPGDSLQARVRHAVTLYRRGFAPALLFTGGQGADEPRPESVAARELAINLGVPARATSLETASTSTRENARFAADICREQGWTTAIVVSDPYHLWRGQRNLRQAGITAYPSPARACRRNREWPLRVQWTARETLAVLRDLAIGH
ncbi:MAG TPA: YdcF family protein [Armatimonadota bacterium]|nr:YdcF family protein [Armatimonadota bacterium]